MNQRPPLSIERKPFFVIGSPRSGTTLLRLLLTSHPSLVVPPECGFILWLHSTFGAWTTDDFASAENISHFASSIFNSRKFETWGITSHAIEKEIALRAPCTYADACAHVYLLFGTVTGHKASLWGDKNNYYLSHIEQLAQIFPDAKFIHIVRDGRDVACSYREVMTATTDSPYRPSFPSAIDEIAQRWSEDVKLIQMQFAALDPGNVLELRYEDLTGDPVGELTRVCRWLGCEFHPGMLEFNQLNKTNLLEPIQTMDWKRRTLEPISSLTVGRHKTLLNRNEIMSFNIIANRELRAYEYI